MGRKTGAAIFGRNHKALRHIHKAESLTAECYKILANRHLRNHTSTRDSRN